MVSAHGTMIRSGSIVITMVLRYPSVSAQLQADLFRVLSSTNELTDGTTTIPLDNMAVTVGGKFAASFASVTNISSTLKKVVYLGSQATKHLI